MKVSKICNDLRLLSSGPRAGLGEINLPPVQPGSSIMPGKVNPVIPEVVNQVAYQVIGNDLTVTFAAEAGQLQLNAFEPVIALNILQSMRIMTRAMTALAERCIKGITANEDHCRKVVTHGIGGLQHASKRINFSDRLLRRLPLASASLVGVLGAVMLVQGLVDLAAPATALS